MGIGPDSYGPTALDPRLFSGIADSFFKARDRSRKNELEDETRATLRELGPAIASGDASALNKAAARVMMLGDLSNGAVLLKLGEAAKERKLQEEAGKSFRDMFAPAPAAPAAGSRAAAPSGVHVAENEDDTQRLERATGMNLWPQDVDATARTVYGEAASEPLAGQAAVAGVIRNRAALTGRPPAEVVRAPGQFEPWMTPDGRSRMASLDPASPRYRNLADMTGAALDANNPNPAGDATHFYAPKAQAALGRKAPGWDDGSGVDLGNHRFFSRPQDFGGTRTAAANPADLPIERGREAQFTIPGNQDLDAATPSGQGDPYPRVPTSKLIAMAAQPHLPASQKEIAKTLLTERLQRSRLTDEQREYYMAKAEGFEGSFVDYKTRMKQAGATTVNNNVTAEKGYDQTVGKGYGETFNKLQEEGRKASGAIGTLNVMEKLISDPNFYSGAGAGLVTRFQRGMVGLGIADADKAAPNEMFEKLSNRMVIDMSGGSFGTGFSNADREFVQGTAATLGTTREGNRQIIDMARKVEQRKAEIAGRARDYAKRNGGRVDAGFDDELAQWAEANPLFAQPGKPAAAPLEIGGSRSLNGVTIRRLQ